MLDTNILFYFMSGIAMTVSSSGTQVGYGRPLYCRRSWEVDHTSYIV